MDIHALELRLARLVQRARQHFIVTTPSGKEAVVQHGFSKEAYLLIEKEDAEALEKMVGILPEYESLKVDAEHAKKRAAERKAEDLKKQARGETSGGRR